MSARERAIALLQEVDSRLNAIFCSRCAKSLLRPRESVVDAEHAKQGTI